ncbi:MAG TPA: hypothetical protein ENI83_02580 [Gammaproteobacteria bacterium]|nr:hypothetical protein [Gammaproteobacteria bacterium]
MRHAVARTLILFILSANLVWAADMDEICVAPESGNVLIGAVQPGGQDTGLDVQKGTFCSHCCHASAHYVGLPPVSLTSFPNADNATEPVRLLVFYSFDKEPPLPPPNI